MVTKLFRLNKWNLKPFLFVLLALIVIGGIHPCEKLPITNPNLKLVVGDTTEDYDSLHCIYPVVSPDGKTIYYVGVNSDSVADWGVEVGSIYSVTVDGTNNRKLADGLFDDLAISRDGGKLAVHPWSYRPPYYNPESLILILNLPSLQIDTFPALGRKISGIEFDRGGERLYYVVFDWTPPITSFYRLRLSDSTNEYLYSVKGYVGFDLFNDNSIYRDLDLANPQINPVQEDYVIGGGGPVSGWSDVIRMRYLQSGNLECLPESLIPYDGRVGFFYWFPDGNTIVFSAQDYFGSGRYAPGEIWVLKNLFEQIEEER